MNVSRQSQLVLVTSLGLTALLLGGVVGGVAAWRTARKQINDAEFLQQQLERVSLQGGGPGAESRPLSEAALVRVDLAARKSIRPQRPIIGRLVEVRKVTVASEVMGRIVDLSVEEGTAVAAGETVLAKVDDVWCRLALDRFRAQVASAEAKLKYERLELERHRELADGGAVSRSELESKHAAVDELQATLEEAMAAVEEGTQRINRSVILAPFDGTVVAKHAELGGHVSPGTPIVDVVSRGRVDARLMVPEMLINMIHTGQAMPIRIDPLDEEVLGRVASITPYGPTASRTFPVRVRLDDQGGRLKVGMSVTAMIATGAEREALVVSKDAVLVRPDGCTVWVAVPQGEGGTAKAEPVPVTITARIPEQYAVEAEAGQDRKLLAPGAQVVVEGAERLMPGQQVRIVTLEGAATQVAGPKTAVQQEDPARPAASAAGAARRQES